MQEEEEKDNPDGNAVVSRSKKKGSNNEEELDPEEERTKFLQRVLLDYLAVNGGETDHATMNARHFYICQWYRDANAVTQKPRKIKVGGSNNHNNNNKRNKKRRKGGNESSDDSSESEQDEVEEEEEEIDEKNMSDSKKSELFRIRDKRKNFLVSKIPPFGVDRGQKAQVLSSHIDHDSAHLIVKY